MTALQTPAADAPASEWGRLAVSIPGSPAFWAALDGVVGYDAPGAVCADGTWWFPDSADRMYLDVDHAATAGCFLALLGLAMPDRWVSTTVLEGGTHIVRASRWGHPRVEGRGHTLGRAAIAAAAALGRWPGGGA